MLRPRIQGAAVALVSRLVTLAESARIERDSADRRGDHYRGGKAAHRVREYLERAALVREHFEIA